MSITVLTDVVRDGLIYPGRGRHQV